MLYIVIERFKDAPEIYRRLRDKGRMMPLGLDYIASWISEDMTVCYQLMKTDDRGLFEEWMKHWRDLMDFEITAVRTSAEVVALMNRN